MSRYPPSDVFEAEPWHHAMWELHCHRAKGTKHTWIETLNRLAKKGEALINARGDVIPRAGLPEFVPERLSARMELWDMDRLLDARHAKPHHRVKPKCDYCPILVLSLFGKQFVIDGGTRLNRRIIDGDVGPHRVVVLEHHERDI